MKQVILLLRYKLLAFIRMETKLTPENILKNLGSGIIYAGFAAGAFFFSKSLIGFLLVEIKIGLFLLHEFISMILFIFFLSVNLGNIIVSYSTLYKTNEINFLLTRPIQPVKIFLIKFLDNFFYSSSTLLLISSSLLAGYVYYFKLSIASFILLFLNFIVYMFSAGSLGVILLLILIKIAELFGVRKVIYGLIISYISIVIIFFRINSPRGLVNSVMQFYPLIDKDNYLSSLIPPIIKLLPNNWLSQTAYWLVKDNFYEAVIFTLLQVMLSVFLFAAAITMGYKWYFKTWLLNLKLTGEYNSKRKEIVLFSIIGKSIFRPQSKAIIKKDLILFWRDPSQMIHFFILLFLIVVFAVSVAGIKFVGLGNFYLQTMIYLSIFLFNLLLITTLSLRFIFPVISLEGEAFWKIKSAPVKPILLIKSKLLTPSGVILIISLGLSFFSNYKFGLLTLLFSEIVTLISAITILAINFGMGGAFANYKEKNAIRIASSQGASLSFLINLLYMLFLIVLLLKPLSEMFLSIMINKDFSSGEILWALLPIIVVSSFIIFLFFRLALNSLKKDF